MPSDNNTIRLSASAENNPDAAAIVHAVLGLGHSLGMATCAEGVETSEQLRYLRSEGCSEVQGFFYGEPRAPEGHAKLLELAAKRKVRK